MINPLTPGDFQLENGAKLIISDPLKKASATWQHAFLSNSARFQDTLAWTCAVIKILRF